MARTKIVPVPEKNPEKGGSYVRDPDTGDLIPVGEYQPAPEELPPPAEPAPEIPATGDPATPFIQE